MSKDEKEDTIKLEELEDDDPLKFVLRIFHLREKGHRFQEGIRFPEGVCNICSHSNPEGFNLLCPNCTFITCLTCLVEKKLNAAVLDEYDNCEELYARCPQCNEILKINKIPDEKDPQ